MKSTHKFSHFKIAPVKKEVSLHHFTDLLHPPVRTTVNSFMSSLIDFMWIYFCYVTVIIRKKMLFSVKEKWVHVMSVKLDIMKNFPDFILLSWDYSVFPYPF